MTKTSKPMVRIHDLKTNEIIDREMTDKEFELSELEKIEWAKIQAQAKAKTIEKAAILDRIGLTADELKTILG